jgi:phospholipid/cholesterol/gamma-HCH transport system ATP-binding protein
MDASNVESVIKVRDLVVAFGDQTVLKGVDLDLKRGEVLGFVGASGGGKSVLMRTIIGLVEKQQGMIETFGRDRDHITAEEETELEKRWGVLFQNGALFSSLNVLQNVQFPLREYLKVSDRLMDEIAIAKLEMVGLDASVCEKSPSQLSGGMVKRAALARSLALDPEIVFLDEPTSGLDPISAGEFDELILALQETLGLTVYMVTHDLYSLHTVCDRVVALVDGKIAANGPVDTLEHSEHPWLKAYFGGSRGRAATAGHPR